ncbi:hypothetical protein AAZX31_18G112300 [Glycine max]|uniref:Uncharacterized protein n=1 Tax=Glycine max TaxID=3847 RepID=K7MRH5_SOYBN|nr:uncharacterized protein LOC100792469 [Glycine max]KAG4935765.1 hypothetical protein JHK85_050684 [Glycine max]KAH1154195.1 hypothetical protein GYH30_049724 [Glycine max]KAH1197795.1 hypothetical protein GmHk_18G051492 [Glycine max]KRG99079.1 hypothetical protein GLYMA_18G119200v4 [Glycine max]|eukprot:XP_003551962.1 uncharacterized protein LOC100792469 [Glycine max]
MCERPVRRIPHEFIPRIIKPRRVTASELWPNLLRDPIIHNFIPTHITTPTSASLFASKPHSFDSLTRECPCTLQNDMSSSIRFVKQTRTASDSHRRNWNQVHPEFNMGYRVQVQQECRLPGRTNNKREIQWHNNSENRLAGKRKMYDLDDNLECSSWPLLTETLDEEDSDETSDSSSDSETYSGPS